MCCGTARGFAGVFFTQASTIVIVVESTHGDTITCLEVFARCEAVAFAPVVLVDALSFIVAGVQQADGSGIQDASYHNLRAGVGQEHPRAPDQIDLAIEPVEDVASFSRRDGHREVTLLAVVLDDGMLGARVVDGVLGTRDEQFLADGVVYISFVIGRNDLDVDAGTVVEFDGTELATAAGSGDKRLGWLWEHDRGAVHIALGARFVQQDAVLELLERGCFSDEVAVGFWYHFDTSAGDVERDLGSLDDDELSHGEHVVALHLSAGR